MRPARALKCRLGANGLASGGTGGEVAGLPRVLRELEDTPEPKRTECLSLLSDIPLLQTTPEIDGLVEHYIEHKIMPADADGDARHLAVATFWKCDILASWNCRHIANASKTDHIVRTNAKLGYKTPKLVTPLELLEVEP